MVPLPGACGLHKPFSIGGSGMKLLENFVWFWKESKKFTGYKWPKLLVFGIMPCFRFLKGMMKGR
jgi:hypothetical protein